MKSLQGVRVALWALEPGDLEAIEAGLMRLGCEVTWASSFALLQSLVRANGLDLVVARLYPGRHAPLDLLRWLKEVESPPAVIVAGGQLDVPLYLEAMREGARDAVALTPDEKELARIVSQSLEDAPLRIGSGRFPQNKAGRSHHLEFTSC